MSTIFNVYSKIDSDEIVNILQEYEDYDSESFLQIAETVVDNIAEKEGSEKDLGYILTYIMDNYDYDFGAEFVLNFSREQTIRLFVKIINSLKEESNVDTWNKEDIQEMFDTAMKRCYGFNQMETLREELKELGVSDEAYEKILEFNKKQKR